MALFVVEHSHAAERCPAGHPQMGPMLLKHVAPSNFTKFGLKLHGDAVVNGGHRYVAIVEANGEDKIREFMAPFSQIGAVKISPASSCEQVVTRGNC